MRSSTGTLLRRFEGLLADAEPYVEYDKQVLQASAGREIVELQIERKESIGSGTIGIDIGAVECQISLFGFGPFDFAVRDQYANNSEDPVDLVGAALYGGLIGASRGRFRYLLVGDFAKGTSIGSPNWRLDTGLAYPPMAPAIQGTNFGTHLLRRP